MPNTPITNIAHLLDLTAYAGDFDGDYDMDAVHRDYADAVQAALPEGAYLYGNGEVVADVEIADQVRELDFKEIADSIDAAPIFERHDRVIALLDEVEAATAAEDEIRLRRVNAISAAKDSGRFTVEEIAEKAHITRDGVYKLLARHPRVVVLANPEQATYLVDTVERISNGILLSADGATVYPTDDALGALADLDEHDDGHFDGRAIWIGGTDYPVTRTRP